jgi:hypothetical protein
LGIWGEEMTRSEFHGISEQRKAAIKRLRDAKFLLNQQDGPSWRDQSGKHARGAMYLAGYAIECKLKSIAMETLGCRTLEELRIKLRVDEHDIYSHGLERLATMLGLYSRLRQSRVWRDFGEVNRWRPSWRYDPKDWNNGLALEFLEAVERVYYWLESNR